MNIEAKDVIDVMRQQLSNAMYEAAVNAVIANQLRKRVTELENAQTSPTPTNN